MKRPNRHRLSIDVHQSIYDLVKQGAKERNITITRWVLQAFVEKIKRES